MIIKRERSPLAIILLAVLLIVIACVSLTFGQIDVPVGKALAVIGSQLNLPGFTEADYSREQLAVIWYIRLPRMLVGVLVGAALGISGAVMQGIFSNPLADPGLIGISSGAATGAVLSIALGAASGSMFAMPAFAFCGSICAVCLTVFLAMRNGKTMVKKNDRVYIQAGGGIVADSVLDNEFQETVNKAGACMTALRMTAEEE